MNTEAEKYGVRAGQVWEDNDCRLKFQAVRGRRKILALLPFGAAVECIPSGRRTIILYRRFRPNSTGYRLISDVPTEGAK